MKKLLKSLRSILTISHIQQRAIVLYCLTGILFFIIIDRPKAYLNNLNNFKSCEKYLEKFVEGKVPFREYKFRESIVYYRKLARHMPSTGYGNLGFCYYHLVDYRRAVDSYRKAIEAEPGVYTFYYDMGVISLVMRDFGQAADIFKNSLTLMENTVPYSTELAKKLQNEKKYEMAMEVYRFITLLSQDQTRAYYNIGLASFMKKDYRQAIEYLDKFIEDNPEFPNAFYYRAMSWLALGKKDLYEQDWQKVLSFKKEKTRNDKKIIDVKKIHFNVPLQNLPLYE